METANTNMDFTQSKLLKLIKLDDNFVLKQGRNIKNHAAKLVNFKSGLYLKLCTDQPGIQVYNAPKLNIINSGLNNIIYKNFAGICLEA